ncbi:glycerophosphodiester phosphodiesterase [Nocardioides sambongensis]|uniref:glycerophosphodiester phosphodiesterase n=1 Tax=Nocardioides sambongensis TaxID=2589074 RepID=UPI00112E50F6|nr:glycerophosphodiester phosphodiesterase [Nocardioides sambongensis]
MRASRLIPAVLTALALTVPASTLSASTAGAEPVDPAPNPWLEARVMNMAHSGGENEAPMNTMYAFERAAKLGADMLELDVHSTADGRLVVIHDATVDRTTNGTGQVEDLPVRKVRRLDAAHWFVPGRSAVHGLPAQRYPLRGARYGKVRVRGHQPKDFRVPQLWEVFKRFPRTPINIEIKGTSDADLASYQRTGRLLARFLNKVGRTDVIVASFNDAALTDFHQRAPQIGLAPGMAALTAYVLTGTPPMEGTVALQVPVTYQGIPIVTRAFVDRAHSDGYAVHVWFSGSAPDDAATYRRMIDTCADGLMPARPTVLETILDKRGIVRPGQPGVDPCA